MHILIDARGLENNIDGIGQISYHLIRRLPQYDQHRFSIVVLDNLKHSLPASGKIRIIRTSTPRFTLFEAGVINRLVKSVQPDRYLNTSPYIPVAFTCPSYFILCDTLSTYFRGHFKGMNPIKAFLARRYFRYLTRRSIDRAREVLTISKHSRKQIVTYFGANPDRVRAVHLAADSMFKPVMDKGARRDFVQKHGLPEKFILHVGNLKPYKNIRNILIAFSAFKRSRPNHPAKLIFTCGRGRGHREALDLIDKLKLKEQVRLINYLEPKPLCLLYNVSMGLFFPSLEEGFGLPVLEAMCCKVPVVTSKDTATEEVAGGHAFLVDPTSIASMVEGLNYLADFDNREDILDRAYGYAKGFSWEKTADTFILAVTGNT